MKDEFDINWGRYAEAVNGKYYSKKNDNRLDYYEQHYVKFTEGIFVVEIEVYIQLMPERRSDSRFLERYTKVALKSNQDNLKNFSLKHKGFLSGIFSDTDKVSTGLKEFDKKYTIKTEPVSYTQSLFDIQTLNFLLNKKVIEGNLQNIDIASENVFSIKFPGIIYTKDDIENINRMIKKLIAIIPP